MDLMYQFLTSSQNCRHHVSLLWSFVAQRRGEKSSARMGRRLQWELLNALAKRVSWAVTLTRIAALLARWASWWPLWRELVTQVDPNLAVHSRLRFRAAAKSSCCQNCLEMTQQQHQLTCQRARCRMTMMMGWMKAQGMR